MNTYDRERHLKAIANFHKAQAKMPFDEKIRVLIGLQRVATGWKDKKKTSA